MCFFNKKKKEEKKQREKNNQAKMQLINLVETIKLNAGNADVILALNKIAQEYSSQPETASAEAFEFDAKVNDLLLKSQKAVLQGNYSVPLSCLNRALMIARARRQFCQVGGVALNDTFKDVFATTVVGKDAMEQILDMIDEKQIELDSKIKEFNELQERFKANQTDKSLETRLRTLKANIFAINTQLGELLKASGNEEIAKDNSAKLEMFNLLDTITTKVEDVVQTNEELKAVEEQKMKEQEVYNSISQQQTTMNTQMNMNDDLLGDINAELTGTANQNQNGYAQSTGQVYGSFNANAMGTVEMGKNISDSIKYIDKGIEKFNNDIENSQEEIDELTRDLSYKLQRRINASAVECLSLDGEINAINSKRGSLNHRIQRYRQEVTKLEGMRAVLDKVKNEQDIIAVRSKIAEMTQGNLLDIEGLAQYINSSIEDSNKELSKINDANIVANAAEIDLTDESANSMGQIVKQDYNDAALVKDEHAFDNLYEELKIKKTTY